MLGHNNLNNSYFEGGKYYYPPVQTVLAQDDEDIGGILDNRVRALSTLTKNAGGGGVAI
jgi:hypothetical protein